MTDKSTATMHLPMDLIAPAIQAHVNSAVIEALKGTDSLITKLVAEVMGQKVDGDGKPGNYHSNTPWLTWAVHNIVRDAVKTAIREHLASKQEVIKKAIDAEMRKSNSKLVRELVDAMAKGMADKLSDSYRMNITFAVG